MGRSGVVFDMKPIVIYLDQCAVSEIVKDPNLVRLRSFMEAKSINGLICCPLPFDTILESSRCGRAETRNEIFAFHKTVSGGSLFRNFFAILADELLALVRPDFRVSELSFTDDMDKVRDFSAGAGADFTDFIRRQDGRLKQFKASPVTQNASFEEILGSVSLEPVSRLWRDLGRIVDSTSAQDVSGLETPNLSRLLLKRGITKNEAEELSAKIKCRKMESIPIFYCHNRLAAMAAYDECYRKSSNFCYNDIIDQERMSTAIAYSEFAITDKAMASRVSRSNACEYSHCRVFSVTDMSDFERVLMERIPE